MGTLLVFAFSVVMVQMTYHIYLPAIPSGKSWPIALVVMWYFLWTISSFLTPMSSFFPLLWLSYFSSMFILFLDYIIVAGTERNSPVACSIMCVSMLLCIAYTFVQFSFACVLKIFLLNVIFVLICSLPCLVFILTILRMRLCAV